MNQWSSTRARRVLAALLHIGWIVKRQTGSHRTLYRPGWPDVVFHDNEELGPRMLARIAKRTRLSQKICSPYPGVTPSNPPLKLAFRSLATSRSASGTDN